MLGQILIFEIPILLLLAFLAVFISKDKIFYGKIQIGLSVMTFLLFALIVLSILYDAHPENFLVSANAVAIVKIVFRTIAVCTMVYIVTRNHKQNLVKYGCYILVLAFAIGEEMAHGQTLIADNVMSVCAAMYYCYLLSKAYKGKMKNENVWDDATGLYNLNGFTEALENLKRLAVIDGSNIWLVAIDIKHLADINNSYGYTEGNESIKGLASIISNSLEANQIAGHPGADEFLVAIKAIPDNEEKKNGFIARITSGIKNYSGFDNKEYNVEIHTASEEFKPLDMEDASECVNKIINTKQENKALRRKIGLDESGDKSAVEKEEEKRVIDVINGNRINYAFQPIVSAKDGTIVAYEALMRPDTNPFISPLTLLRHADNLHRNYDIEKLTFKNVLKQVSEVESIRSGNRKIFINSIPGSILNDEDYSGITEKYKDIYKSLVVEITEQSELSEQDLFKLIERSQKDGFDMAIDDYGSGSANTYSLLRIRPNVIKLDRLLISDIDKNTKKQYFVNSIVTFAKQNGMKVLAEGVETLDEMKMVIRLQVDLIQGYYTARPAFEILDEINEDIRHSIVDENMRGNAEGERKVYVTDDTYDISLVQLALEEYTGITVSSQSIRINGNTDYTADMNIKIKDGLTCTMILRDVKLSSVDDLPCIEVGEGAHLTLMIEGECSVRHKGIRVPEGSSILFKGSGNLSVSTKGHNCYGIGGGIGESFGAIVFNMSGNASVRVDGEECIAIGGGIYKSGTGVLFESGTFDIKVASVTGVGIGCFHGDVPVVLKNLNMNMELRVNDGTGIGSLMGKQTLEISNFLIDITGSGSKVCAIGTIGRSGGFVQLREGTLIITLSGQEVGIIAVKSGQLSITSRNCRMQLKGEGNTVCAIGSTDKTSVTQLLETTVEVTVNAAEAIVHGATDENVRVTGGTPVYHVNE